MTNPHRRHDECRKQLPRYEPTHEEIKQACEEIQRGWCRWERRRREVGVHRPRVKQQTISKKFYSGDDQHICLHLPFSSPNDQSYQGIRSSNFESIKQAVF